MEASLVAPGDNPDLTMERQRATFPVDRMAAFIHGGPEIVRRRHEILAFVEKHPELNDEKPMEFMDREEKYDEQARKARIMTDIATEGIDGSDFFGEGMLYQSLVCGHDLQPLSLHYVMFLPTLQGQADEQQMDQWLEPTIARALLGTYAQTELGHGTNLSRLETTATYDPATEEFVLHSPTTTATKWWPGGLGKSANFAIVMAQLWTNGKCQGPHPFIVQLRDVETHQPLKTIKVGDIGPKLGMNGSDNGFLRFNQHRIPRRNMLMRYAKVLPNGEYLPPKHQKLSYGSMVFVRSVMIRDQAMRLGAAVTIATRYSAVRRQGGELKPGDPELQILDYQSQQYRIFPHLAATLCFLFAASQCRDLFQRVSEQLTEGNTRLLASLHAMSSGLKAVITWEVAKGIEQCRLACGGHGYSQASALPEIYGYAVGGCTYEGENIVLLLQVAKQLLKAVELINRGEHQQLAEMDSYLAAAGGMREDAKGTNCSPQLLDDGKSLCALFERAAREQLFQVYKNFEALRKNGDFVSEEQAWNAVSVDFCRAAKLHVKVFLVRCFFDRVEECRQDRQIYPVVLDLAKLFALNQIVSSNMTIFSLLLGPVQLDQCRRRLYALLARLRPNALALADSLDFSDRELRSVLGRRDGNVYPALLRWAEQSPMNREEVTATFNRHLGPMMREGRSKL